MNLLAPTDCKITFGYGRCIIQDLTRNRWEYIPIELGKFIVDSNKRKYSECCDVKEEFKGQNYLYYCLAKEYLIKIPEVVLENFVPLETTFHHPSVVTSIIFFVSSKFLYPIERLVEEVQQVNCPNIDFILHDISFDQTKLLLAAFDLSVVNNINIYFKANTEVSFDDFVDLWKQNARISNIIFYEADKNEIIKQDTNRGYYIISVTQGIDKFIEYGNSGEEYMKCNIQTYIESCNHNLYYNRKVIIDESGNIKNSVHNDVNFGNIQNDSLKTTIEKESFREYWNITKDKIDVCMLCEYRNMCIDSRVPIKRGDGSYYFVDECSYNPFISKWKGDENYMNLNDCGIVVDEKGIKIDEERIEAANQKIWGA
jgi:SPASM domain peptide maturase of grasp-with-spasm system